MRNVSAWWTIILSALLVSAASVAAEGSEDILSVGAVVELASRSSHNISLESLLEEM